MCSDLPDGSSQNASSSRQVSLESLGLLDYLRPLLIEQLFSESNQQDYTDRSKNAEIIVQVHQGQQQIHEHVRHTESTHHADLTGLCVAINCPSSRSAKEKCGKMQPCM